jgi:hypothetical protein
MLGMKLDALGRKLSVFYIIKLSLYYLEYVTNRMGKINGYADGKYFIVVCHQNTDEIFC